MERDLELEFVPSDTDAASPEQVPVLAGLEVLCTEPAPNTEVRSLARR